MQRNIDRYTEKQKQILRDTWINQCILQPR